MPGKKKHKRRGGLILLTALLLLAAAYTALCAVVDTKRILPHTLAQGVDIGGMTSGEAAETLKAHEEAFREAAVFTISAGEDHFTVDVGNVLAFDGDALAEKALENSRGFFLGRGAALLKACTVGYRMGAFLGVENIEGLHELLEKSGVLEAGTGKQMSYRVEPENSRLLITKGAAGTVVDEERLVQEMTAVVLEGRFGSEKILECPMADLEVMPVDLGQIYEEIHTDAVNAALDPEDGYSITESVTGISFDMEEARRALEAAEDGAVAIVPLICTEPEITTEDMQKRLFADVLGTYRTAVGGTQGRLANVRLAAEKCDGAILLAGDEFSFNEAVGEQTAERGFYEANAILDGRIVQAYGGGICQVSSTIFASALYAGLEITERWNHDLVPRYIPAGMDAAVSWPGYDFRLANNTQYPVRLDVRYEGGYLTVNILGTKTDDTVVEIRTEELGLVNGYRDVETYRENYNSDRSQVYIEKAAYSSYLR